MRRPRARHLYTLGCLLGALAIAGPGCGAPQVPGTCPPCATQSSDPEQDPAVRGDAAGANAPAAYSARAALAVFDDLLAVARKYHVFTGQTVKNLGIEWEDQVPALRREFSSVDSREDLMRALNHFANSLHNPHCYYNTPDRPRAVSPGFEIEVEWDGGSPRFYVAAVDDAEIAKKLQPGDVLVAFRGVEAERFLTAFHRESNGNNWRSIASDLARFFSRQSPDLHGTLPGASDEWVFHRRDSGDEVVVRARWQRPQGQPSFSEFSIDYDSDSCAGLPKRDYGAYRLAHVGGNYCVYMAEQGKERRFPIVRHFSFLYGAQNNLSALRADHENLRRVLGQVKRLQGVILDLRDNHGGNNPNWFLDWYAPAPYYDHFVYVRLHENLDSPEKLRQAGLTGWGPDDYARYLEALEHKAPEQEFMEPRPFFCPTPDCKDWDNLYRPKNRVTTAPVALLVGPGCVSSCDQVVFVFKENRFGPLVGIPGAAGYTVTRVRHQVSHPDNGEYLGFVAMAFSYEISGKTKKPVEAVVVEPDHLVEPTFANRATYDRLLVETAIRALGEYDFPEAASR